MMGTASNIEIVKQSLKSYLDFPKPGVIFWDVFGVLSNPKANKALIELFNAHSKQHCTQVQAVCALESRGFLFGPLIALHLQVPFVPIRKKGKLPGEVTDISFDLEYGSGIFEIQKDALNPGTNVLIVDDLLATGGSFEAACKLINHIGSNVDHCLVIIEIEKLNGRSKVPVPVHSFIKL